MEHLPLQGYREITRGGGTSSPGGDGWFRRSLELEVQPEQSHEHVIAEFAPVVRSADLAGERRAARAVHGAAAEIHVATLGAHRPGGRDLVRDAHRAGPADA